MPSKNKKQSPKSLKKSLVVKIEEKLTESLAGLSKKINEKKYEKLIHKAAIILSKDLAPVQTKTGNTKNKPAKAKKTELTDKPQPASEQIV